MSLTFDQLQVGADPNYHTQPLRPGSSQVSGASLSGFAGSGATAPVFEPQSPYTVASANSFYDSGADNSLTPAVSSVCIEVDPTSFPDGQENGYMFPKGTVVTLLGHGKKGKRVGFRDTHENVYVAKLGFADNAFNPLEAGLPREEMPLHSYDPNIRLLGKKSMPQYVNMVRDKYNQAPFSEKELNKQTPYVLGRKEKLYNDFKWKQYI